MKPKRRAKRARSVVPSECSVARPARPAARASVARALSLNSAPFQGKGDSPYRGNPGRTSLFEAALPPGAPEPPSPTSPAGEVAVEDSARSKRGRDARVGAEDRVEGIGEWARRGEDDEIGGAADQ